MLTWEIDLDFIKPKSVLLKSLQAAAQTSWCDEIRAEKVLVQLARGEEREQDLEQGFAPGELCPPFGSLLDGIIWLPKSGWFIWLRERSMAGWKLGGQSRHTVGKVNCGNGFFSSVVVTQMCVFYNYIWCVCLYYSVHPWNPHFSLPVCCSCHVFCGSCVRDAQWRCILKGDKRNLSGLNLCLVLMLGAWKEVFSDSKREVSGSPDCVSIALFSWSHQGAFQLISLLFKYPHVVKLSAVCNTHLECFNGWSILSNICKSGKYKRVFFLSCDIKKAKLNGIAKSLSWIVLFIDSHC